MPPITSLGCRRIRATAMSRATISRCNKQLFKNSLIDVAYVGNHGLKLQGFSTATNATSSATGTYSRPSPIGPRILLKPSTRSIPTTTRCRCGMSSAWSAGLTLLDSFTWEHSLDNASARSKAIRLRRRTLITSAPITGSRTTTFRLPISLASSTTCRSARPRFRARSQSVVDAVLGGWQVSAINTARPVRRSTLSMGRTPPSSLPRRFGANYRGANLYRPNRVPACHSRRAAACG